MVKLALGTVQFGQAYGVSNTTGQTSLDEVHRILDVAQASHITLLDTAPAYGDAEAVLGNALVTRPGFSVVTKCHTHLDHVRDQLEASCWDLQQPSVYGLLLHNVNVLFGAESHAWIESLMRLKQEKKAQKIGVSVYTPSEMERVLSIFTPDIVQCPLNVFNQQFIQSGMLAQLHRLRVEVHVRSVFLQGLLLMEPESVPSFFSPIKNNLRDYKQAMAELGLTPLQAALAFIKRQRDVQFCLVGVNTPTHLQDIVAAFQISAFMDFGDFALQETPYIDPRHWQLA